MTSQQNQLVRLFTVLVIGIVCGILICKFSCCNKIAVVDVNKVVMNSAQVKSLRSEQIQKTSELQTWIANARADVEKQSDKKEQEALLEKYNAEFAQKQQALEKGYADKLTEIDRSISEIIEKEAKKRGYKVVLAKSIVLFGGDVITDDIIALVQ